MKTSTEALIGERYIMDYIHKNYPHLLSLNQGHYGGNKDPKGMDLHYFGLTVFYNVKKAIKRGRAAFSADMTPELKTKVKEVYKGEPEVQKFVQPCKKIKDAVENVKKHQVERRAKEKNTNSTLDRCLLEYDDESDSSSSSILD